MTAGATRLVVGCMTGTSIDGLDSALVRIDGGGLSMRATVERANTTPLDDLAAPLRALADQAPMSAGAIADIARRFALLHARAVRDLLAGRRADLVVVHGQTVFHAPPVSWQLVNAPVIAAELGVPVVSDLRAADLARGGQGAPITPLADWALFRDEAETRAVVNLGGFCNVTLLAAGDSPPTEPGRVRGMDVCACNQLLDTVARRTLGAPFDQDGAAACGGSVNDEALDDLRAVLLVQATGGRSLGTGDEAVSWIGRHWRGGAGVSGPDLAATACEAIAERIASAVSGADRLLLAGGGARNRALARAIHGCCSAFVETTERCGVGIGAREAACMAVLGALCQDRLPISLPAVTGVANAPIAGVWVNP